MHVIAESINAADLVFDIGANLGDKAEWFAAKGARVVAVEPQPALIEALVARFRSASHVTIVPKGLAEKPGRLTMSISGEPALSTFSDEWKQGRFKDVPWIGTVEIEVTTLDALVQEFGVPKYAKIDVEGYERQVVAGLSRKIGVISFEFTAEGIDAADQVCARLKTLGYGEFNVSFGEEENFHFPEWQDDPTSVTADIRSRMTADPLAWGDIYAR